MDRRTPILMTIGLVTATALGGCTLFGADEKPLPDVEIESIAVPDSMVATQDAVLVSSMILPPTDEAPWAISGIVAAPGSGDVPTVWTSDDGSTWSAAPIADDFEGSFSGDLAGSDQLTTIAGSVWKEGTERSSVWTSTDRAEWIEVELPENFASAYSITDAAVAGTDIYAVAVAADGSSAGIRLAGDETTEFALPEVGEDEVLAPISLIADDGRLLLVATPGPEGSPTPTVAYASPDGGESWGDAEPLADELAWVSEVVWTGAGYSATGSAPASAEPGAPTRPAAWFSTDGAGWTAETVPAPPEQSPFEFRPTVDATFGVPLARDGVVTAVASNNNAAISAGYTRSVDGAWSWSGDTAVNASNGIGGFGITLTPGTTVNVVRGGGYARIGHLSPGGWTDVEVLSEREDIFGPEEFSGTGESLTISRKSFSVDDELLWRNSSEYRLAAIDGDTLTEATWDPERAGALIGVTRGSDGAGAEVLVGGYFPPGGGIILAEGWFRATADAAWTPMVGFATAGETSFTSIEKTGDVWTAVGTYAENTNIGTASHAIVWQSPDGVNWTQSGGDFGSGALESSISDVCTLPDGTPVAVGWAEGAGGVYGVSIWTGADGVWTRESSDAFPADGFAESCATGDDGVVLSAHVGARSTLYLTENGSDWEQVFRAERGINLGEPVSVDGGFAASGSWSEDGYSSAVVWLSADGTSWNPVAIPSYAFGTTTAVAANGTDLLVAMDARTGSPVSVIRDIAAVIERVSG